MGRELFIHAAKVEWSGLTHAEYRYSRTDAEQVFKDTPNTCGLQTHALKEAVRDQASGHVPEYREGTRHVTCQSTERVLDMSSARVPSGEWLRATVPSHT